MIDLKQLREAAFHGAGADAVVSRDFLKQVHLELTAGRAAQRELQMLGAIANPPRVTAPATVRSDPGV